MHKRSELCVIRLLGLRFLYPPPRAFFHHRDCPLPVQPSANLSVGEAPPVMCRTGQDIGCGYGDDGRKECKAKQGGHDFSALLRGGVKHSGCRHTGSSYDT